jgi:hypothetical protein
VLTKSEEIPTTPTHMVIRTERVRQKAASAAPGERELPPGTMVRVLEFAGDGEKLGYVPFEAILKMQ